MNNPETRPHIVAFVSGKGGSGKTLLAATFAAAFSKGGEARNAPEVFVLDADMATGGMSYYLGFKVMQQAGPGFCDLIATALGSTPQYPSQTMSASSGGNISFAASNLVRFKLLPIGNHRALLRKRPSHEALAKAIGGAIQQIALGAVRQAARKSILIIDCRGGIDEESIATCRVADDIVLVAETDATSIQACQHLVDVLADNDLSHLLRGFVLNKAFDSPSQLAKVGSSLFRCRFLGAIPFDIDAVRRYVQGELPSVNGLFNRQVEYIVENRFEGLAPESVISTTALDDEEFSQISLRDPLERIGSFFIALLLLYLSVMWGTKQFFFPGNDSLTATIPVLGLVLGLLATSSAIRRGLGRMLGDNVGRFIASIGRLWRRTQEGN